jgi:hypothetical protein
MKWFLITLVFLAGAILGVAFYRNWIVVETKPGDDSTLINIKVDRAKAREDLKEAREQTRELAGKAREGAENLVGKTLKGEITAVNAKEGQLTVMADGQPHTVRIAKDASIERDQVRVDVDSLQVGEQATIKVKEEDGVTVAHSVTVGPKSN